MGILRFPSLLSVSSHLLFPAGNLPLGQIYSGKMGDQGMKNLKLKAARAGKDLSQQALADLVGVSRQTIVAVEKGDYNPTINLCIAICKALDKTLDELFWED